MALKWSMLTFRQLKLEKIIHKNYKHTVSSFSLPATLPKKYSLFHPIYSSTKHSNYHFQRHIRYVFLSPVAHKKIVPFNLSDIGEGIVEVTVKEWYVKPEDRIAQFDNICEVQSDKASVTITSRYDGVVKKLYSEVEHIVKVGSPLIDIEVEESDESVSDSDSDDERSSKSTEDANKHTLNKKEEEIFRVRALATPAVRRIAKEHNINIQEVKGTGKEGRVLKEDILNFIDHSNSFMTPYSNQVPPPEATKTYQTAQFFDKDVKEAITGFKKAMVKSMMNAWTIPHFSYCDEIVISELVQMKDEIKKIGESKGVKLTFMPFYIKAASLALLKYPQLNSHVSFDCESLTIKAAHNIGVAMDTYNGLIVPNIKNVQKLSVLEVAKELNRLQSLGAKGQLGLDDLKDGTFTLSNIGSIGGTYTKPIIFPPQVIIGAIGKVQVLPRFDSMKNVVETSLFNVSWSADHRVVDGATVARFSNLWKEYLVSPKLLLQL